MSATATAGRAAHHAEQRGFLGRGRSSPCMVQHSGLSQQLAKLPLGCLRLRWQPHDRLSSAQISGLRVTSLCGVVGKHSLRLRLLTLE